jgi:hypothetical protein
MHDEQKLKRRRVGGTKKALCLTVVTDVGFFHEAPSLRRILGFRFSKRDSIHSGPARHSVILSGLVIYTYQALSTCDRHMPANSVDIFQAAKVNLEIHNRILEPMRALTKNGMGFTIHLHDLLPADLGVDGIDPDRALLKSGTVTRGGSSYIHWQSTELNAMVFN